MWPLSEHQGSPERLDRETAFFEQGVPRAPARFGSMASECLDWKVTAAYDFRQASHINLQDVLVGCSNNFSCSYHSDAATGGNALKIDALPARPPEVIQVVLMALSCYVAPLVWGGVWDTWKATDFIQMLAYVLGGLAPARFARFRVLAGVFEEIPHSVCDPIGAARESEKSRSAPSVSHA